MMMDAIDTPPPPRDKRKGFSGIANPVIVGVSIVGALVAIVAVGRSLLTMLRSGVPGHAHDVLLALAGIMLLAAYRAVVRKPGRKTSEGDAGVRSTECVPQDKGMRRHRRFVPRGTSTLVRLHNGQSFRARIIDVSIRGVALSVTLDDVQFSTIVTVGARRATPLRRTEAGIVLRFEQLLDPLELDETLVL